MEWDKSLSIDIHLIDEQHKELIDLVNKLKAASERQDEDPNLVSSALTMLVSYANTHFTTEEEVMRIYDYPGYEEHKKVHEKFKEKVTTLVKDYEEGEMMLMNTVLHFLEHWVEHHIKGMDKQFAPHVKKQGLI